MRFMCIECRKQNVCRREGRRSGDKSPEISISILVRVLVELGNLDVDYVVGLE
jgi:hypothetical protein